MSRYIRRTDHVITQAYNRTYVAKGHLGSGRNMRVINVSFDEETFALIRDMAKKEESSFAEAVRTLVDWALEAV